MVYIIVACIVILSINVIAASKFESIANMKGHTGYFWWCFWLGVIGWAMVIALPDRKIKFPGYSALMNESSLNTGGIETPGHDDSLPEL